MEKISLNLLKDFLFFMKAVKFGLNPRIPHYVVIIVCILLIKFVTEIICMTLSNSMKSSTDIVHFVNKIFTFCKLYNPKFQTCIKYYLA